MKKFVRTDDPNKYIFEHILKGDRGDGIPNFLSDDDTFVMGKRQKPLSKKRIDTVRENGIESLGPDGERGYYRNRQLVDLDYIPDNITDKILNEYYSSVPNSRSNLLNYFIKHKLKNLMETIGEF
jgi:hypothetical protein